MRKLGIVSFFAELFVVAYFIYTKILDADCALDGIQLRSLDAICMGWTQPGLKLGAKLWISFKCSSNANIS